MDFVKRLGDTSCIPQIAVGGIARAEIIDRSIVNFIFFKPQTVTESGLVVPVCELLWSIPAWLAARIDLQKVAAEITRNGLDHVPACPADVRSLRH
jgi:hypothetical protein